MKAEILSTGDEIRTGSLVDTNAAYIAERLEANGLDVVRHQCVGDDRKILADILTEIGGRADVALVTGGLGPTEDDITAAAAADAVRGELVLDETALKSIQAYFAGRNLPMPPSNRKQAMLPSGAEVLYNPVGTAPGFALSIGRCRFFFMPGVPFEMKRMFYEQVLPQLEALQGKNRLIHRVRTVTTFGLTESATGEALKELPERFPDVRLGLQARFPEIHIRLYAGGAAEDELQDRLSAATAFVTGQLGNKVLSVEGESLPAVVGAYLRERNATLALAESCTGGLIAHQVTDVSGSSDYFIFSGVTYHNDTKINVLGVSPETLRQHGAVSEATAGEMAEGARRKGGTTYGLSTSGIAGPTGGTPEKPVGTVCIGLAAPEGTKTRRLVLQFATRQMNKQMFAAAALNMLRRELMGKG